MPAASSPSTTAIRPAGFHALQIEINRALYMDERDFALLPAFDRLKQDLVALRDALAALPFHYLDAFRLAAERVRTINPSPTRRGCLATVADVEPGLRL